MKERKTKNEKKERKKEKKERNKERKRKRKTKERKMNERRKEGKNKVIKAMLFSRKERLESPTMRATNW